MFTGKSFDFIIICKTYMTISFSQRLVQLPTNSLKENAENLAQARATVNSPFDRAEELGEKSARLEQLNNELNLDKIDEVVMGDDEEIECDVKIKIETHDTSKKAVRR